MVAIVLLIPLGAMLVVLVGLGLMLVDVVRIGPTGQLGAGGEQRPKRRVNSASMRGTDHGLPAVITSATPCARIHCKRRIVEMPA